MRFRLLALSLCVVVCGASLAQQEKRLSKEEERQRFHSAKVVGQDAASRMRAYEQRLRAEAASPFGGLLWRNVGPEVQGGRVIDIAAPAQYPDRLYVAFATGGLWRTEDDGITWTSLFDNQSAFGIGAFAVSADGKTLWVATGEANSQRTVYSGTGIFKSTDEGKTWQYVGLPESHHIGSIVMDPRNPNTVYVAASGHLYSEGPDRGVYKTTDGGKTWNLVLKVDDTTGAFDLVMDPRNSNVLLASMWDHDRRAWNFLESGKSSAVYRTDNGGKSWSKVTSLPTGERAGRIDMDWSKSDPRVVYAVVDNQGPDEEWEWADERVPSGRLTVRRFMHLSEATLPDVDEKALSDFLRSMNVANPADVAKQVKAKKVGYAALRQMILDKNPNAFDPPLVVQEIFRSDDGGKTFKSVSKGDDAEYQYYFAGIKVDPKNADDVIALGFPIIRSTDGGKTWSRIAASSHVDYHAVWYDPRNSSKLWIGCDGGLYVSGDHGKSVRHIENLAVGQATMIAVDNKRPYNIYVGFQDNGTMKGPSNYVFGRTDPNAWKDIGGGDGSAVAVDPRNDGDIVFTSSQFGNFSGWNQLTNDRWFVRPSLPKGDPAHRFNWITPILISTHHPDIVYIGSQRLYRSFDDGRRFLPISPDLTKNKPNGDVPYSTIKTISESPLKFGVIYVGADDGRVTMTRDGGVEWVDIPTPQPDKWVCRIVASKYDEGTVFCAQTGYREDDFAPYLWKSTDYGKTWTSIAGGLPADEPINVVLEDPSKKDTLFVGTDMGVWVTQDGGSTWLPLNGLPHLPVQDLALQARDGELVAATHGRSVYVLPLKYVYQYPELKDKDLAVLDIPSVTRGSGGFRSSDWGYENGPRWDSTPPAIPKARVLFFAKRAGKATLRIKKDDKVLKETTFDAKTGFNTAEIELLLEPAKPIEAKKGEAFKSGAEATKDPFEAQRAKYLDRGEYTLEIVMDGHSETGTLRITAPANRGGPGDFEPGGEHERGG